MSYGNDTAVAADEVAAPMLLNYPRDVHVPTLPQLFDDVPREVINLTLPCVASLAIREEQIDHLVRYRPLLMAPLGVQCHGRHSDPPSVSAAQEGSS